MDKAKIGIVDDAFELCTVRELIEREVIERPLDGNHGEIHPKGDDFVDEGVPFIMASDVRHGRVDYTGCKFITEIQAEGLRKGFARNGDVLVTHKATIGETAIVEYDDHPFVMLTPQVTYYRVKDSKRLSNRYLLYYFQSDLFQKTLKLWASSGATRAYLGILAQQKLPVILPPLKLQNKIAAVLGSYDDLIRNNRKRIAALEQTGSQLFREWFVRLRFPGHESSETIKGIPKGWNVEPMESVAADILDYRGKTPTKLGGEWADDGIIALSALNVKNGRLIRLEDANQVSESLFERWMKKKLRQHDILLTSEAPLGECYILMDSTKYVLSQRLFGIRANPDKVPPCYLYHYLLSNVGQHQLLSRGTGATVSGIRQSLLWKVEVLLPPDDLMKDFEKLAMPLLQKSHELWLQNRLLKETRDRLLNRLVAGKLALHKIDVRFPPSMTEERVEPVGRVEELVHA